MKFSPGDRRLVICFAALLAARYLWARLDDLERLLLSAVAPDVLGPGGMALVLFPAGLIAIGWRLLRVRGWGRLEAALASGSLGLVVGTGTLRFMLIGQVGRLPSPAAPAWLLLALAGCFLVMLALARLAARHPWPALGVFAGAYALTLSALSWFEWSRGNSFDTVIFTQSLWNTLHGNLMWNSIEGANHLRVHFSPLLLAFVPGYALWPDGRLLLAGQGVAVAGAALPLFALLTGRPEQRRLDPTTALLVTAGLLLSAGVLCPTAAQFHEMTFAPVLFLGAVAFLERRRPWGFALCCLGLLAVKEIMGPVVMLFALPAWRRHYGWAWVFLPVLAGVLWTGCALAWLMGGHGADQPDYFSFAYQHLGHSLPAKVHTVLGRPGYMWDHLRSRPNTDYLAGLLWPYGWVVPWTAGWSIFALPHLLANTASKALYNYLILLRYWHATLILAALSLAFGRSLARWQRQEMAGAAGARWVAMMALAATLWVTAPWLTLTLGEAASREDAARQRRIAALIPPRATVQAPQSLLQWVGNRPFTWPMPQDRFDHRPDCIWRIVPDLHPMPEGYRLAVREGRYELWQREAGGRPLPAR